ncbi:hypothetical protein MRB53_035649 [Persea americana]|uniref:Uncharacterized protein n=1 Tax=Persea americana TaxID=3435 RepID=A0ACC2K5Q7_PERAE|nr:hypothetical protein MRB53_035649 [Persea americana]
MFEMAPCFLWIAKDPRFERPPCTHKGTYAGDCPADRVTQVLTFQYKVPMIDTVAMDDLKNEVAVVSSENPWVALML